MTEGPRAQDDVRLDVTAGVATIRFTRAAKRNAVTTAMYAQLAGWLTDLATDADVRVVCLTGSGGSFTAGNDLADLAGATDTGPDSPPRRFLDALVAMPQVLLIGVCGPAIGVGSTVLLHADLAYATRDSVFAMPFVGLGLVPEAAATLLLPAAVGHVRAAAITLLGERFGAEQACEWGLLNAVLDGDQAALDRRLHDVAQRLLAQPAEALAHTRRLLRAGRERAVRQRLTEDGDLMGALLSGPR